MIDSLSHGGDSVVMTLVAKEMAPCLGKHVELGSEWRM